MCSNQRERQRRGTDVCRNRGMSPLFAVNLRTFRRRKSALNVLLYILLSTNMCTLYVSIMYLNTVYGFVHIICVQNVLCVIL